MNIMQKTRLNLMLTKLKNLYQDREYTLKNNEEQVSKIDVKIKLQKEKIESYKREIGL